MKLSVTFHHIHRPPEQVRKLEEDFKAAMLDYEPDVTRIARWQEKRHYEYTRARDKGNFAVLSKLTDKEQNRFVAIVRFE